ncbi:DUF2612 domain-containing protein [Acinetobacter sp. V91_7]|uniref:DUF2612 domain-containing protein n=1 Tax=unclassified Acinetobacter TaxID=196816 RepID=UPI00287BFF45|nr:MULTISPECIES: DUF2612 domain-containing protein [unclassified Acinetobacter]MDS7935679.1 DUF2612 domain-containing protein [Acinetobacter sp. V91_4B]MDS7964713.1 DUF2612 domain-containing protein [Acinetobacter sp. V91_7]MDS8025592.1 DUF2612 domain-containing protein [Acinetobacter sp. V91_13]
MKNIQDTLMSQYANSPIICQLIEGLNCCIDPSKDIEGFYHLAWDLNTAQGFGLDMWGRIVGVDRNIGAPNPEAETFGFKTRIASFYPFNQRPFSAAGTKYASFNLNDRQFRTLILVKAASNIVLATAPNINRFLKLLFDQRCYFLIIGHMKARYLFEFNLRAFERLLVYKLELLPRPSGVLVDYKEIVTKNIFGFAGTGFQPFNQGVLA